MATYKAQKLQLQHIKKRVISSFKISLKWTFKQRAFSKSFALTDSFVAHFLLKRLKKESSSSSCSWHTLSLSLLVLHSHTYKTLSHFQTLSPLSNSYMEESGLFPTRFQYLFPPSLPLLHTHVEGIHPFNTYLFFISSFTCKVSELDKREKSNL